MSGHKCSGFTLSPEQIRRIQEAQAEQARIRRERAERNQILGNISRQEQAIHATSDKIKELLRTTPQGFKDTFHPSVKEAEQWMNSIQKTVNESDKNGPNASLNVQLEALRSHGEMGQKNYQSLIKKFTEEADEMTKIIRVELLDLNLEYERNRGLIEKWAGLSELNKIAKSLLEVGQCIKEKNLKDAIYKKAQVAEYLNSEINGINAYSIVFNQYEQEKDLLIPWFDEEIQSIEKKMRDIKEDLTQGKHEGVKKDLEEVRLYLEKKINEAKILEEKDQKRKYVFESLKKVCNSMGFDEVKQTVEGKGTSSRIVYTIDTYTQGKIRFYISLDNINADSGIVENHCLSEFDKVSTSLQENFGVKTEFKRVDEQPDIKKIGDGYVDGGGEDTGCHVEGGQQT